MVSREEMDGERERADVGVEGTEDEENEPEDWMSDGNRSLNFAALNSGEEFVESEGAEKDGKTWCSGEFGARRRGNVLPGVRLKVGEDGASAAPALVRSSSESSEMSHTLGVPECM
jgi:hypothetical protein